jgi:acetyl esterase
MNDLSHLDPEIQVYLRRMFEAPGLNKKASNIDTERSDIEARAAVWSVPAPDTIESRDWLVSLPGREIGIRIQRKKGVGRSPVILFFHGGGFYLGSYVSHDTITWRMAIDTESCVISVNYRRLPDSAYPDAMDDIYGVLKWVKEREAFLDVDASRIAVAGDSAGGLLAAGLAIKLRDEDGPKIAYQALLYPMLDLDFTRASYAANRDPLCRSETLIQCWTAYLSGNLDTTDAAAVPMRSKTLKGLPPAYVLTTEFDPLRDEAYAYADRLTADGVHVDFVEVKGSIHGFLRATDASKVAAREVGKLHAAIKARLHP